MRSLLILLACWSLLIVGCDQQGGRRKSSYRQPASQGLQVAAFTASWCGPCRADKPQLAELSRHVRVVTIDVDQDMSGAANQFRVDSLPLYVVLTNRGEQFRTHDIGELRRVLGR